MAAVGPVQHVTLPQQGIGVQVHHGQAGVQGACLVRHLGQGAAVNHVHPPLGNPGGKQEEGRQQRGDQRQRPQRRPADHPARRR